MVKMCEPKKPEVAVSGYEISPTPSRYVSKGSRQTSVVGQAKIILVGHLYARLGD